MEPTFSSAACVFPSATIVPGAIEASSGPTAGSTRAAENPTSEPLHSGGTVAEAAPRSSTTSSVTEGQFSTTDASDAATDSGAPAAATLQSTPAAAAVGKRYFFVFHCCFRCQSVKYERIFGVSENSAAGNAPAASETSVDHVADNGEGAERKEGCQQCRASRRQQRESSTRFSMISTTCLKRDALLIQWQLFGYDDCGLFGLPAGCCRVSSL